MRSLAPFLFLVLAAAAGCSEDDVAEPTTRPCEQLRDHLIDLRVGNTAGKPADVELHRAAMRQALGDDFVSSCERLMSPREIACAIDASDVTAASACQQGSASAAQP